MSILGNQYVILNPHTTNGPVIFQDIGIDVLGVLRVLEIWLDDEATEIYLFVSAPPPISNQAPTIHHSDRNSRKQDQVTKRTTAYPRLNRNNTPLRQFSPNPEIPKHTVFVFVVWTATSIVGIHA